MHAVVKVLGLLQAFLCFEPHSLASSFFQPIEVVLEQICASNLFATARVELVDFKVIVEAQGRKDVALCFTRAVGSVCSEILATTVDTVHDVEYERL